MIDHHSSITTAIEQGRNDVHSGNSPLGLYRFPSRPLTVDSIENFLWFNCGRRVSQGIPFKGGEILCFLPCSLNFAAVEKENPCCRIREIDAFIVSKILKDSKIFFNLEFSQKLSSNFQRFKNS